MHSLKRFAGCTFFMLCICSVHASVLNKCRDDHGHITYSDKPCGAVVAPSLTPPARRAGAAPNKAEAGKLTRASVAATLRYALVLGDQLDYQAQCALAASDLVYKVTDLTPSPPLVLSGGRDSLCQIQRETAMTTRSNSMRVAFSLDNLEIHLEPSGLQAQARYETFVTMTSYGQKVLSQRCKRDDVLRVYGSEILYAKATAVCQPAN